MCSATVALGAADTVVVRVGETSITTATLERRLAALPAFQLNALGDSPEKIKRSFVDSVLVPELLFGADAERQKLGQRAALRDQLRELLRQAMDRDLRATTLRDTPVSPADIKGYFEENLGRFQTPRRLRLWRILVDNEALAKTIIAAAKGSDGPKRWSALAREHSLDRATHLRDGDLGFVRPDGSTETPTLRVDPALFAAADGLADGQVTKEPIKEGSHFAVVWRRGSVPAVTRTLEQEQSAIRQVLERKRVEQARSDLLDQLRKSNVTLSNESLLESVNFDFGSTPQRPPMLRRPHPAPAGSEPPAPTDRGLR
jgi:peptidyl-prolyl cis-trans isomerase C